MATDSTDPFRLLGTVLDGKYRVDRVIGEGGFGVVYGGMHLVVGQPVAIKCMKPASGVAAQQHRVTELFLREARVLFSLTHPNIVRLYDVGSLSLPSALPGSAPPASIPYVVLEYIHGASLDNEIASRRTQGGPHYTAPELFAIFDQVLDAMAFAHERGVTHRDVKPSNVMLVREGQRLTVKVVDFGIARVTTNVETTTGAAPFTPRYAAPEQWDATLGPVGPRTDVYALGLLFAETATLNPALPGQSISELLHCVMNPARRLSIRTARPDLPPEVDHVLGWATRMHPGERIPSARDLKESLGAALRGPVPSFLPPVPPPLAVTVPATLQAPATTVPHSTTLPQPGAQAPRRSNTGVILGVAAIGAVALLGAVTIVALFAYRAFSDVLDLGGGPVAGQTGNVPAGRALPPMPKAPPAKGYVLVTEIMGNEPIWTKAEIEPVIRSRLGDLDACYEQHVGKKAPGELEWDLTLMVSSDGVVSMPQCDLSGDGPVEAKAAATCFATKASAWRFPPASGRLGLLTSGAFIITLTSNPSAMKK